MPQRTFLAAMAIAGGLVLAACGPSGPTASSSRSAAAATATPTHLVDGRETARGRFTGRSGHDTSGHASVFWDGRNWVVSLASDFFFDGAPDPVIGFGNNGEFDTATILGPLESDTGAATFIVPASIDVGDYNQIYVWCELFAVPLGAADLTLL